MNNRLYEEIKKLEGPIVVFGAGGFIGANLLRAILKVRDDCYGVTHQKTIPWRLKHLSVGNVLCADINDSNSICQIFDKFVFKTIFNLAAYGGYSKQKEVELIYKTNVLGVVNLLEIASKTGFAAYVHSGSSSEYGLNSAAPSEGASLIPNSHYSVSKISTSYLIQYLGNSLNLPVINLRFYSVYGPFEEPDRFIPMLLKTAEEGGYPFLVDPAISRDFVYIDDVLESLVLGATADNKIKKGCSINIATGKKTTIGEVVGIVKNMFNLKSDPVWGSMQNRSWDLKDWYGNPSYAKTILNWEAKTSLHEGLSKTITWMREYKKMGLGEV